MIGPRASAAEPLGHGREPVLDVLDGNGVHGYMAEGRQEVSNLLHRPGELTTASLGEDPDDGPTRGANPRFLSGGLAGVLDGTSAGT